MDTDTEMGGPESRFPRTRHSLIHEIQGDNQRLRARAIEAILAAYWKPVYKYVRLRWRESNEDAKDLTQGFFTRLLEKDALARYDTAKGGFRTYLRACLDSYLANEHRAERRLKRGGGAILESVDFETAEGEG